MIKILVLLLLFLSSYTSGCTKEDIYKSFYKSGRQAECQQIYQEEGYYPEGCEGSFDRQYEEYQKEREELNKPKDY